MTDKLLIDRELVDSMIELIDFHEPSNMTDKLKQLRNLPVAKMLDLGGLERWDCDRDIGMERSVYGGWVIYSDLTDLVAPTIGREDLVDFITDVAVTFKNYAFVHLAKHTYEGDEKAAKNRAMAERCESILDRIKGVAK